MTMTKRAGNSNINRSSGSGSGSGSRRRTVGAMTSACCAAAAVCVAQGGGRGLLTSPTTVAAFTSRTQSGNHVLREKRQQRSAMGAILLPQSLQHSHHSQHSQRAQLSSSLNGRRMPTRSSTRLHVATGENEDSQTTARTTQTAARTAAQAATQQQQMQNGIEQNEFVAGIIQKIGTVDEDRIAFPEYESGEVPRMFSSLEYAKNEQGRVEAVHNTGSVFGAGSLVAGTMVGAGILALPTATASVGFLPSTVAMGVAWFYMTMSGLLIAELSLNKLGQSGKLGSGLLDMYQERLGQWGIIGSVAYFFLHYAVVVAYIAQGGVNVADFAQWAGLSSLASTPGLGQAAFAGVCGLGLFAASPAIVERVNNVLVIVMAACFAGIIGLGAESADFNALVDLSNQHPEQVPNAFPIIFLALVFQNVVPTVVTQLEGDRTKITKSIIGGTTIPTLMFLAWNAVILGNIAGTDFSTADMAPIAMLQASGQGDGAVLGALVSGFSSIALLTSLIGFTYGLLDAWTDVFKISRQQFQQWKAPLFGLVFLPPLALSVMDPDIFYNALDYGGAFGVSTLFLVLPPIMIWGQRYGEDAEPLMTKPMVPFGKLSLGSMWKAAGTLILEQGAEKLGVFEWVQEHIDLSMLTQ